MILSSLPPSRERAMVVRWKEEIETYGTRRENRQKVLDSIKNGYDTLSEITAETGIPRSTVYKILKRLVRDSSVTRATVRKPKNRTEVRFEFVGSCE